MMLPYLIQCGADHVKTKQAPPTGQHRLQHQPNSPTYSPCVNTFVNAAPRCSCSIKALSSREPPCYISSSGCLCCSLCRFATGGREAIRIHGRRCRPNSVLHVEGWWVVGCGSVLSCHTQRSIHPSVSLVLGLFCLLDGDRIAVLVSLRAPVCLVQSNKVT